MNRRLFLRVGGAAAGALALPPFLARVAAAFPAGTTLEALTYGVQVATQADFAPESLKLDVAGLPEPRIAFRELEPVTTYYWRANASDGTVTSPWSETFDFTTTASVGTGEGARPRRFELGQNQPNPFRSRTTIPFETPAAGHVLLEVHNVLGQRVAVLVDEDRAAGRYEVHLDARDFESGTYFYTLRAGTERRVLQMTVVR